MARAGNFIFVVDVGARPDAKGARPDTNPGSRKELPVAPWCECRARC